MYVDVCRYPQRPDVIVGTSGAEITGCCEVPNVAAHLSSSNFLISFFIFDIQKFYILEMIIYVTLTGSPLLLAVL